MESLRGLCGVKLGWQKDITLLRLHVKPIKKEYRHQVEWQMLGIWERGDNGEMEAKTSNITDF